MKLIAFTVLITHIRTDGKQWENIVKYNLQKSHKIFYEARPRQYEVSIKARITQGVMCYTFSKVAKDKMKDNPNISFACADINCSLAINNKDESLYLLYKKRAR